jgi:ERF superfamily
MNGNEVAVVPGGAVATVTPMALLQLAVQGGADIDKLKQLMDLQERYEANEARKAFVIALNAFKANPPTLYKNKKVEFDTTSGSTSYRHATLDQVSLVIGQALSEHGISHRWEVEQKDSLICVTCVLTHERGHSERVPMQATADTSGKKNSIQAIGSTVTYLQRYTLLSATGMAVKNQDDDGNSAEGLPDDQFNDFVARIKATTNHDDAKKVYKEAAVACAALKDKASADKLKDITGDHRAFIDDAKRRELAAA